MKKQNLSKILIAFLLIFTILAPIHPENIHASEVSDNNTVKITYAAKDGGTVSSSNEQIQPEYEDLINGSTAIPAEGWMFSHWESEEGNVISKNLHLQPNVSTEKKEYSYIAVFQKNPAAEPENNSDKQQPEIKQQNDQQSAAEPENNVEKQNPAPASVKKENAKSDKKISKKVTYGNRLLGTAGAQDAGAYFHAEITSNKESYASGSTAVYSVKYTIDRDKIHEGDYIYVTIPSDIISSADLAVASQHFSSVEDLENGKYKLTFGAGAESALRGSFTMYLTTSDVSEQQKGTITVGNDTSSITVNPKGPSGTGVYTDTIMKDAAENGNAVGYGDYDYSEGYGDSGAQIGILKSYPGSIKYRIFVNNKEGELSNVVVTDTLPDGMVFDPKKNIEVTERKTGNAVDPGSYNVSISGNTLVFSYNGTLTTALQINYWVNVVSEDPLSGKYTNRADITYEQEGKPYSEHRNYVLQGSDYSAANGEKSVDKTEISSDPDDQTVTYTIKFWNQKGFSAGEIALDDILDEHVHFISASTNEYFSIRQDENNPQKIHLENTKAIPGTKTVYVRFMCDFTDVPAGYTVENSVGGNVTKTRKTGGKAVLAAVKTVDGNTPSSDQVFDFELLDEDGTVLQTKQNEREKVSFDPIIYGKDDMGKTYTYRIREKDEHNSNYVTDDTVYTATVVVDPVAGEDGVIGTKVTYKKNDAEADIVKFNNKTATISVPVTKVWKDNNDQDGIRPDKVMIKLLADGKDTGKAIILNKANSWEGSFTALDQYRDRKEIAYTIEEADVSGYTSQISGTQTEGYTVTNIHTPETTEVENEKPKNDDGKKSETKENPPSDQISGYVAVKSSETAGQKVKAGEHITYKIDVTNTGDTDLTGIWIRDYVPEYTKFVSAGQNGERGAIDGRQHVDWFIESLEVGQTKQVKFTVEVLACIPDNATIRNTAYTENTANSKKPSLNRPDNPKEKTNEIVHHYKAGKNAGVRSGGPRTGDDFNMLGYVLLMSVSGLAVLALAKRRKKRD